MDMYSMWKGYGVFNVIWLCLYVAGVVLGEGWGRLYAWLFEWIGVAGWSGRGMGCSEMVGWCVCVSVSVFFFSVSV